MNGRFAPEAALADVGDFWFPFLARFNEPA
jgi:hypothetical protein